MSHAKQIKHLPQHIAIIMDGNGRWAKKRGLPRLEGHKQGAAIARSAIEIFMEYGIPYLTFYTFSTENWKRPAEEVNGLFRLLQDNIDDGLKIAQEKNVRLLHLGKLDKLPRIIRDRTKKALELTKNNTGMTLCLAFNYGSRDEIVEAARSIVRKGIKAEKINEALFSEHLYTAGIPDPDLIIRTGGEMRLSNFLIWQSAYAEIYFTSVLWPDFDKSEIDKAILTYSKRQRRFGNVVPD